MPLRDRNTPVFYTLKSKIAVVLLLSSLVPIALIGGLSYYTIASMLNNKVVNSIHSQVQYTAFSIERELSSLNHVAMQLSFEHGIGKDLVGYITSDVFGRFKIGQQIKNYIFLISYTNPNIGFIRYYFADTGKSALDEETTPPDMQPGELPQLYRFSGIAYHGPHRSLSPASDALVLSVDRRLFIPGFENLHIYVETNPLLVPQLLGDRNSEMGAVYVMAGDSSRIVYSEQPEQFALGDPFEETYREQPFHATDRSYLFSERSDNGWTWAAAISKAELDRERDRWIHQFAVVALVTLVAALGFAWLLWRIVYKPLISFIREIRSLQTDTLHSPLRYPRIAEFDYALDRFEEMRRRIRHLLLEGERKEKMKSKLELEKLLFQINPHFIHNTLDTIRWLARLNGQQQIENFVATLNKVLHYNMGKGGKATIGREIDCLNDYVTLQQMRYDFQFELDIKAEDGLRDVPIPRFILQPLVENALFHGLGNNGKITVRARYETAGRVRIEVSDNGPGMTAEETRQLLERSSSDQPKRGTGIGIHYVQRMIHVQYGDSASLDVNSGVDAGTSIVLSFPIAEDGGDLR